MKNIKFARRMQDAEPSIIREMLKLSLDPSYISFAGGDPDPEFFPISQILSFNKKIDEDSNILFQYSVSEGNELLRKQIIKYIEEWGITAELDNIIITSGGQQGLDLTGKLFIEEGDIIGVEGPSYMGAINAFRQYMPKFDTVEMDDEGISVEEIKRRIEKGYKYKLIYVIPDFQNPTGKTMSYARRKELLELAKEHDIVIIEDNPYYSLRFEGENIPPIKALDDSGNVIFIGSFSKVICPANRVGWICADRNIIEKYVIAKQAADIHSNELSQLQTAHYLENYSLDEHLNKIRYAYKEKKDAMISAIRKYFPNYIKYTNPQGGLFVWLTLPEDWTGEDIMNECIKEKVTIIPGSRFFADESKRNNIRLSYATMDIDSIEEGIKRIAFG
jgi:2-aminoadipate transaminase